jgi:hypothetical protein
MLRVALTSVLAIFVLNIAGVWAEDHVYFREASKKKESKLSGTITKESPNGIALKTKSGAVQNIPASNIVQVEYGNSVVEALRFRAPDNLLLQKALPETRPDKKAEQLRAALKGYEELDQAQDEKNGTKLNTFVPIHRYLQYRIAQTKALLAREDAGQRDAAIAALSDYKTSFADGWEIAPALQLLASLQVDKGDTEGASQTYAALAELAGLAPEAKRHSQLQAARLLLRARKFADAQRRLTQVESALPKDDPQRTFVAVYLMQSRIAQNGNLDGIEKKLEQIVHGSKDNDLLALAHNALGDYHRAKKDDESAFWEYCKVDLLYDRDKEEHAKALYYLSKLDGKRAEAYRARLQAPAFDGTLYQRLAAAEK